MDWIGNIFIVIGLWYIGNKKRWAFLFSVVGETCWIIYSLTIGLYSLAAICVVFAFLAARSYYKWGKQNA
jgi:nicotinamide riboside transporter PnuC